MWMFLLVLALAGTTANAGDYATKRIPDVYALHNSSGTNQYICPRRAYLDELPLPSRIQDKRRIKIHYNHIIKMGQTKLHFRLKAKPKLRSIIQIELRF